MQASQWGRAIWLAFGVVGRIQGIGAILRSVCLTEETIKRIAGHWGTDRDWPEMVK